MTNAPIDKSKLLQYLNYILMINTGVSTPQLSYEMGATETLDDILTKLENGYFDVSEYGPPIKEETK